MPPAPRAAFSALQTAAEASAPADAAKKLPALLKITAGATMISFSGVYVKLAQVAPAVSAFYRVLFGGLFLLAVCGLRRQRLWNGWPYLALGLFCGLFFALDLILYHASIERVGPGLGTILPNFQVFLLAAIGLLFLGETLRRGFVAGVPLAMLGLILIVGLNWSALTAAYRMGVLMGLGAAGCYTGFLLTLRRLQTWPNPLSPLANLTLVSFLTAVLLALEIVRHGGTFILPDARSAVSLLCYGFFSQMLGWLLITQALPRVAASQAGLLLLLQPALAFVWDVLFFQRPTTASNFLGVALALTGIYLGTIGHYRRPNPRSRPETDSRRDH